MQFIEGVTKRVGSKWEVLTEDQAAVGRSDRQLKNKVVKLEVLQDLHALESRLATVCKVRSSKGAFLSVKRKLQV